MKDFESLVNHNADVRTYARRRAEARKRKRQLQKMVLCIVALAAIAACMVILGSIGVIPCTFAAFIYGSTAMGACFTLGLYVSTLLKT